MPRQLRIDYRWLGKDTGSDLDRAFYGDIGIAIDDDYLTRLEDVHARTVRDHFRGSVYQLAVWFAANWWRLRWEPEIPDWAANADWRMAHSMAGAGGGFVWPNVLFASDGDSIAVASHIGEKTSAIEPVRYLNRMNARISADEFEQKTDAFLEAVLSRSEALRIQECTLGSVWGEVLAERGNPELCIYRKLEALCGYDPDEAPHSLLEILMENRHRLGIGAVEEVAAVGRALTTQILHSILMLSKSQPRLNNGGFRGVLPSLEVVPESLPEERPWQLARRFARLARAAWGLDDRPVDDVSLADLVKTDPAVFSDRTKTPLSMPVALQTESGASYDIYFDSRQKTSRRFAVARLVGDHLRNLDVERLLPATKAKTSRQQFQRAFAQEFLCPFDALLQKINTEQPDEDDIREAADFFDVSPLMVRTTLVNKGELDRDVLTNVA